MRTSRAVGSITAALVLVCAARAGNAGFTSGAGNACFSNEPSWFERWEQGVYNKAPDHSVAAFCPLTLGAQTASALYYYTLNLRYQDGTSNGSLMCWVYESFNDGTIYYGATKYSCTNPGGCYDYTTSYRGVGYIQWNGSDLRSAAYHYVWGNYGVECFIPAWGQPDNLSYIVAYESTW